MSRDDGRGPGSLRPVLVEPESAPYAEGSCLISAGNTRVLCTASVEDSLPPWRNEEDGGWVTGEYSMLPRATHTRNRRERNGLKGRTQEIQRLVGRSLRGAVDLRRLGPRTVVVDCDVLQADGGTRTASITGGWIALALACRKLLDEGQVDSNPIHDQVAAVSVGVVDGVPLLDLDYGEDVRAQVDMNVVATEAGELVEVQGTAEGRPFPRSQLDELMDLALAGVHELATAQLRALGEERE